MTIIVHKGTNEIGGSCIEISSDNTTILLDYGTPLDEHSKVIRFDKKIDAILISHPHQDHFGEIVNIDAVIPVYCGRLAVWLMDSAMIFTSKKPLKNNFCHFEAWKSFFVGDFKITPYLVDHSAIDAYAFLIENGNKRVFYSGDFRNNGRKAKLFDLIIKDNRLKNVDVLLMEGTMMERSNLEFPDEQSVEEKIFETFKLNNFLSFYIGSSQNIDSIVSAYKACKKAGKIFVVDMYTAWILEIVGKWAKTPTIEWAGVKVIKDLSGNYYEKIKSNTGYFKDFAAKVFKNIVTAEDIAAEPEKYLIKISPTLVQRLLDKMSLKNANIIYSQWLGYLSNEFSDTKTVEILSGLKTKYNWIYAHTSGHADLEALKTFSSSLKPKKLIPIHTKNKNEFEKHFNNVLILEDGEPYIVDTGLSSEDVTELNTAFETHKGEKWNF